MSSSLRTTLSRVCRRVAAELVVVSSYLIIVIACLFIYFFLARADYNLCPCLLLATGASPLGDMPHSVELASLGLPLTPGGEDPLTAVAGSASSSSRRDPCKLVSSQGASKPSGHSGDSSIIASQTAGFSLGHGFPLIPPKLVTRILKWEYVSTTWRTFYPTVLSLLIELQKVRGLHPVLQRLQKRES